jgi:hypothetical protein
MEAFLARDQVLASAAMPPPNASPERSNWKLTSIRPGRRIRHGKKDDTRGTAAETKERAAHRSWDETGGPSANDPLLHRTSPAHFVEDDAFIR